MRYKTINEAIVYSRDVPNTFSKHGVFYKYLLLNNVAFFYTILLSKSRNKREDIIIQRGKTLQASFIKSLRVVDDVCQKARMPYLLFKTYKYIPEVVDGDIDMILQEKDLKIFMNAMRERGFVCTMENAWKGICLKEGYKKIEPRAALEFYGKKVIDESAVWKTAQRVQIEDLFLLTVKKEVDLSYLLLSILYGPRYLSLYLLRCFKELPSFQIPPFFHEHARQDLETLLENYVRNDRYIFKKRFPIFVGNFFYVRWWFKRVFFSPEIAMMNRWKQLLFFYYIKYKYICFRKLHFGKNWADSNYELT